MPSRRGFLMTYAAAEGGTTETEPKLNNTQTEWYGKRVYKGGEWWPHTCTVSLCLDLGRGKALLHLSEESHRRMVSSRKAIKRSHLGSVHVWSLLQPKQMSAGMAEGCLMQLCKAFGATVAQEEIKVSLGEFQALYACLTTRSSPTEDTHLCCRMWAFSQLPVPSTEACHLCIFTYLVPLDYSVEWQPHFTLPLLHVRVSFRTFLVSSKCVSITKEDSTRLLRPPLTSESVSEMKKECEHKFWAWALTVLWSLTFFCLHWPKECMW